MLRMTSSSPVSGLSRREFLGYCGTLAAMLGLGQAGVPAVAEAIEQMVKLPLLVWSDFQECLGCTVALLQSTAPTPAQLILQQVSLAYDEAAMAAAGKQANENFAGAIAAGTYWVIEGSVPDKMPEAFAVDGKSAQDILKENYAKAKGVIAIGSCACFGNVQAHDPNPTGAMGIRAWLRGPGGIPDAAVVNLPRCPGHGEDLVATLVYIIVMGKLPELDSQARPVFLYGSLIHDQCERRAHFDAGEFVEVFGDEGSLNRWCLFKVGCKGPVTYAPCPTNKWNGRVSWCVNAGPCTGCAEDNFWNTLTPFGSPVPNIPIPAVAGVSAQTIGLGLAGITAVGLGAHFVGQVATGRLGKGAPQEHEAVTRKEAGLDADKPAEKKGGDV
jgi:hydrogenase small subunit